MIFQKDVRGRAVAKDAELWWPRFWQALDDADKAGMPEVAPKLVELADHFREVPDILKGLSLIYGKIGWKVERDRAIKDVAARFPDDAEALGGLLRLYDEEGRIDEADKIAARIRKIDPDAEVDFERAVSRRDFRAAIKELERLRSVRKDRRDIAARIADMLTRAGLTRESMKKLEAAVQRKPDDAQARLALADARFAGGDRGSPPRRIGVGDPVRRRYHPSPRGDRARRRHHRAIFEYPNSPAVLWPNALVALSASRLVRSQHDHWPF